MHMKKLILFEHKTQTESFGNFETKTDSLSALKSTAKYLFSNKG